jgi:ADP-ribose pyrophosphatase
MSRERQVLKLERLFDGRKVALEVHHIRDAAGRETTREVIVHPGSVALLAFPEPGRVLLERIWRYAVGRTMLEIPAGTLEPGEDPAACAVRELAEETGYRAGRVTPVLTLHPSPGILSEEMTVYLAEDLTPGDPAREPGEEIENVLMPADEALAMIGDGRITDAKTVAALLWWARAGKGAV